MKYFSLLFCLFFSLQMMKAQEISKSYFKTTQEINSFTEDVMNSLSKNKITNAYSILRMKWIIPENELDQLESQTIKNFNLMESRYGKAKSYEFVKDQKIGNTVMRKVYLLKFDYHYITFLFTYYNNGEGWLLNSYKFSDEIETAFKN